VRPDEVDAAGRPLRHGGWALRYGPSGRIERLERLEPRGVGARPSSELPREARGRSASAGGVPPARSVDLRFNALGERVLRRIHREGSAPEESRFLYHQNALVAEVGGEGRITRHFIRWQGRVIAIVEPPRASAGPASRTARLPNIVWLLGDHLGTPQLAVDSAGRPVWQARLGVYGEVLESHGTFDQPLRFAGHYHDRDTGLHDNYQRTYDPRHGRYLEPDPLGLAAGWNLHAYAAGNPVQATDPLGLILFAFDGTGNSDPARSPDTLSNVAKFVSLYAGSDRHYMSGVGTFDRGSGIGADAFDTLQATSARRRVDHMLGVLDTALRAPETRGEPVNVDVIGFSRGAAMARDFANTVAARINSGHYLATGRCVSLNFVGLWDTVAQFGLNGQANAQWNLGIPAQARVVVHAVALNEHRRFFPLESIGRAASAPPGGWRLERGFIGDHGDIGGSHAQGDLSDVALGWMVDQARKAGVGLKALDAAWQTVTDPLLHDSRTLLAPGPDRDIRLSPSVAGSASALGSGLDRNRAESMIRRYPYMLRGHDGAATLAGRVDMAAYSTWLSEHYGLDVLY
jgi:RHS repeat-associated protein